MHKRIRLCFVAMSLCFLFVFLNYERISYVIKKNVVHITIKTSKELGEICVNRDEVVGNSKDLRYNETFVAYDAETNTVFIPQDMSEQYWKGDLQTDSENGKLYFLQDDYWSNKENAIETGHLFKLYHVLDKEYAVYNVVFTGMPILNITTNEQFVEEETVKWKGNMWLYDPYRTANRVQQADCEYHVRGGSSNVYEKSSYKLELTNKQLSLLGMREDDDWILNALYDDAGLIHNKLSYQVWREIAASNQVSNDEGIDLEYVEVFRDNEYIGVYALTERIDKKTLSLGEKDILYKCRADRIPEEHNYTNEMTDEMRPIFILKYPKEHTEEDWKPLKQWVNFFCKEQFQFYEEGKELLNMENAIDYNIFTLLTCGVDNMRKNVFFIAECQAEDTYVFKKVPWDLNATWGNPWVYDKDCNYTIYDPAYIEDVTTWCTDLSTLYFYDETQVADLLRKRWKELRNSGTITKEKIIHILDEEFSYLYASGAYKRNYQKWPHGSEYWNDVYIYEYVDKRIDFLDSYFEQLYQNTLCEAVYQGVDYSQEFDVRYYWTKNYDTLSELYAYDRDVLLEHYVLYGKPFGLKAKLN